VRHACRCLGITESGYYACRSPTDLAAGASAKLLATQLTEVHRDSGGVCGAHRVGAELRHGRQVLVGHDAVA
jgi:putative transposase